MTPPTILVRGRANAQLTAALIGLTIVDNTDGMCRCEATFANWGPVGRTPGFLFFDPRVVDFGMPFGVQSDRVLFDGRVMAFDAAFGAGSVPTLTVLAEDRLQDLRMTRRTRTFTGMSDDDVVRQIASDHGLVPQTNVAGPTHATLVQTNQSDLSFVRDRARAIDATVWVDGSTLHMASRRHRDEGVIELEHPSTLLECAAVADLSHQRTSVVVTGWDASVKAPVRFEAADAAIAGELAGGSSGAAVLASTLGARTEMVVHTVPGSVEETRRRAESLFAAGARRFVTVRGVAAGWDLRVGAYVALAGLGTRFSGQYYVAGVRHTFDRDHGARTEFIAESPTVAGRASSAGPLRRRPRPATAATSKGSSRSLRQAPASRPRRRRPGATARRQRRGGRGH